MKALRNYTDEKSEKEKGSKLYVVHRKMNAIYTCSQLSITYAKIDILIASLPFRSFCLTCIKNLSFFNTFSL